MATLIITDVDYMGNRETETYDGDTWEDVTALLKAELEATSNEEYITFVMGKWEIERNYGGRINYTFTVSNTASEPRLTDRGTRTSYTYLG